MRELTPPDGVGLLSTEKAGFHGRAETFGLMCRGEPLIVAGLNHFVSSQRIVLIFKATNFDAEKNNIHDFKAWYFQERGVDGKETVFRYIDTEADIQEGGKIGLPTKIYFVAKLDDENVLEIPHDGDDEEEKAERLLAIIDYACSYVTDGEPGTGIPICP